MLINNIDIKTLGGQLVKHTLSPSSYKGKSYWDGGAISPTMIAGEYNFSTLEVEILILAKDPAEVELIKSKINAQMGNPTIILNEVDPNIRYICSYDNQPTINKINSVGTIVTYNFRAFAEGLEKVVVLKSQNTAQTVSIEGTYKTEVIYEIKPAVDMVEFSIGDFKIKNLKAGQLTIINSKEKTILENGKNKFKDADFWSFPVLKAGSNSIKLSHSNVEVKLKYNPRFV